MARPQRAQQAEQVVQAALRASQASQPLAAVQLQDALLEAVRREFQPQLAVSPELRVWLLAVPRQAAEVQLAPADAPVAQRQPLSSA